MRPTGSAVNSFADVVTHWDRLDTALQANGADLTHLEAHRLRLAAVLVEAHALVAQQNAHTAAKQELSRKVEAVLKEGKKISTFLRAGIRERYGVQGEKLVEFDMQPLRVRTRSEKARKGRPQQPEPHTAEPQP